MAKINIIDGNSVGHAAHRSTRLTSGELQTQAVFGFVRTMRDMLIEHPGFTPMVLWDGKAQWRFDLYPDYKSNRDNDPKKVEERKHYVAQRPYITRALEHLGIRQMTAMKHEADDMAGYLVVSLTKQPANEILLSSGDQDWIQLLRSNVTWRDHRDDSKIVTMDNIMDKTGYPTPYAFLEGKCLQGDTSDVISGVGGIGEKGAPEFIAEFGSVREFWRRCESGEYAPSKKAHLSLWKGNSPFTKEEWAAQYGGDRNDEKAFKKHMGEWPGQGRAIFGRNLRLMQLLKVAAPDPKDVKVVQGKLDIDKFAEVCEELNFASILRNVENFCKPFARKSA